MLEFHKQKPKNPSKADPEKRIKDFQEIYSQFDNKTSVEQSSRCSQCGVPYCQIHCPLNNNIPDWLKYIAEDRLEEGLSPRPTLLLSIRKSKAGKELLILLISMSNFLAL